MARTQPPLKRRTKKVLHVLSELQRDDFTITAPTLIEAKWLLKRTKKCYSVKIEDADAMDDLAFFCPRHQIPNFIASQLEAQGLTDIDSELVRVPPLVSFVVLAAAPPDWEGKDYPTLFHWYSKSQHRTYYLFAYCVPKMGRRRTYTIDDLLGLRIHEVPAPSAVFALAANPELVDIVRGSGSESSAGCKAESGTAVKTKDRSSSSSEELLFKGTMSRRGLRVGDVARDHRELIRLPIRELTRGSPVQEPATRETIREAIREIGREQQAQAALNSSRSTEWKYRGRSDSETPAAEPIQAPGGVSAQKSEGFQRFYKAVVSPTHVRVTAGGRIVPNTRAPSSPTTKRTTDSPGYETQGLREKPLHAKPSLNQLGVGQPIPVMPQFIPGYPSGFQPIQTSVSFMPMALGSQLPPGFSFPQPATNPAQAMPAFPVDGTLKDMHNTKPGDVHNDGRAPEDKQEKLKISPPEFFDYTKPYYYNGQIIYPLNAIQSGLGNSLGAPMTSPMMPIPMFGNPIGVASQLPGQMMHPQQHGIGNTMSLSAFGHQQHGGSAIPAVVAPGVPANANFNAPTAPPPSSIKLSDITKKQIAVFKSSLRYHEDQMLYNRHQIDEKEMEQKIQGCKDHIARFEATLKSQLEYEDMLQRRQVMEQSNDRAKSSQAGAAAQTSTMPNQDARATQEELDEVQKRRFILARQGINTNIGEGGKAMFKGAGDPTHRSFEELVTKPSLSTEAALAPVFEPRRNVSPSKSQQGVMGTQVTASWNLNDPSIAEQQRMSRSFTAPYLPGTSYAEAVPSVSGTIGRPATHARITSQMNTSNNSRASFGVPYLLGSLPRGFNPRDATDYDYVYSRPLTDDEQRARFLYWGKAPKSATRGLPKFDGKHFYPPSPVKEESESPANEATVRRVPNARPVAEHDVRLTKSDIDPFRPMTPVYNSDSKSVALQHASEDGYPMVRRTRNNSFDTQILNAEDPMVTESGDVEAAGGENSTDATSLGSIERRVDRSGARLLPKNVLLKKGPTSSALSSTMAQGLLHHYAGHAAASLSPSISKNQAGCYARDASPEKMALEIRDMGDGGGILVSHAPERVGENCPPNAVVGSFEEPHKVGDSAFELEG